MASLEDVRCQGHLNLHIARTRFEAVADECGHMMFSGGYDYCADCAAKFGLCELRGCGQSTVNATKANTSTKP